MEKTIIFKTKSGSSYTIFSRKGKRYVSRISEKEIHIENPVPGGDEFLKGSKNATYQVIQEWPVVVGFPAEFRTIDNEGRRVFTSTSIVTEVEVS